jgi:glycosyltransferase involved in cell wall biosynthesis
MDRPRFSIIITCHNQEKFITDAVDSALEQSYSKKEVIVVNDASSDRSSTVLKRYGDAIRLLDCDRNIGASAARNLGVSHSSGDYLVFLDGDDLLLPWALHLYDRLTTAKRPRLILGNLLYFRDSITTRMSGSDMPPTAEIVEYDRWLEKDRTYRHCASAMIADREAFVNAGGWDGQVFPGEDVDFSLRMGCSGLAVQILSPATVQYRVHSGSTMHNVGKCVSSLERILQKERNGNYPGGSDWRYARYAFIGGWAWFWIRKGFAASCYVESLKMLVDASPMIATTALRRLTVKLRGTRPVETFRIEAAESVPIPQ